MYGRGLAWNTFIIPITWCGFHPGTLVAGRDGGTRGSQCHGKCIMVLFIRIMNIIL